MDHTCIMVIIFWLSYMPKPRCGLVDYAGNYLFLFPAFHCISLSILCCFVVSLHGFAPCSHFWYMRLFVGRGSSQIIGLFSGTHWSYDRSTRIYWWDCYWFGMQVKLMLRWVSSSNIEPGLYGDQIHCPYLSTWFFIVSSLTMIFNFMTFMDSLDLQVNQWFSGLRYDSSWLNPKVNEGPSG